MNKPPKLTLELLEGFHREHHRLENLNPDPLIFARDYDDPLEGEIAGLVAAALAYGQVGKIVEALGFVFQRLGPSPRQTILETPADRWPVLLDGFTYRFHKAPDLALFLWLLRQTLERHGSLRDLMASHLGRGLGPALTGFCADILGGDPRPLLSGPIPPRHPVRHLAASPASGGAAKRLCLFMRWMIRRDQLDPGYWHGLMDPADLVIPLDTHVARVGNLLGMTNRRSADWKMACEITESLRALNPCDPLKYDFSLFRYGMGGP